MSGNNEHEWRNQQYYNHMHNLTSQWPDGQGSQMGGMQDVDLQMFQRGGQHFTGFYPTGSGQLMSPSFSYHGGDDVDMPTPSTGGFPTDATEGYHTTRPDESYLCPPTSRGQGSVSTASPKSAHGDVGSAYQQMGTNDNVNKITRPPISRSATAPEPQQSTALKRTGSSDEDDDYVPAEETKGGRGRKRQRIPHTAVERRYRENLNAHLDKLRQSVPSLAARPTGKGGSSAVQCQEGVKPSKCEILNGAIEHIAALDKENQGLRDEVKMLRGRIVEMERWHTNSSHNGSYGL